MRRPKVHTATPVRWDMPHCKPRATGYGSIPKEIKILPNGWTTTFTIKFLILSKN